MSTLTDVKWWRNCEKAVKTLFCTSYGADNPYNILSQEYDNADAPWGPASVRITWRAKQHMTHTNRFLAAAYRPSEAILVIVNIIHTLFLPFRAIFGGKIEEKRDEVFTRVHSANTHAKNHVALFSFDSSEIQPRG